MESDGAETRDQDHSEDEHFSDASEGQESSTPSIPTTRVERTDDTPSHGEIPGTAAHALRRQDAVPDEFEIIPEIGSTNSEDRSAVPMPKTVIEKVDPEGRSHGDEPGTVAHDQRKADALPDVVEKAPDVTRTDLEGVPTFLSNRYQSPQLRTIPVAETDWDQAERMHVHGDMQNADESDDEGAIGSQNDVEDDFDDFAEGDEAEDFGTFDEGAQESATQQPVAISPLDISKHTLPLFDFAGLYSAEDIAAASQPYLKELFPGSYQNEPSETDELPEINPAFLTDRSQSLWAQLVAPPPLQPPNWIRSRIRRLFLVSLGVPVDLDEILPASKQKKLILPSIEIEEESSQPRTETNRLPGAVQELNQQNMSAASLASTPSKSERKKRGPAPPPPLDLNAARLLCTTTDAALTNFTDDELRKHVMTLNDYEQRAGKLLEYWLIRKDSANGDKDAFEEVIENLVKHAKKIRK